MTQILNTFLCPQTEVCFFRNGRIADGGTIVFRYQLRMYCGWIGGYVVCCGCSNVITPARKKDGRRGLLIGLFFHSLSFMTLINPMPRLPWTT